MSEKVPQPKVYPVSEEDFQRINPGDLVRYQTTATGHRVGIVKGRDLKRRVKHQRENTAPIIATIGQSGQRLKTVSLTREQLLEWRPQT